jgi:branched-chain amino acid transport system ATP-binding protein
VSAPPQTAVARNGSEKALRLRDVSRSYGGLKAVDGVSFDVAYGERRAIIGPNGAGKTTLFKLISGEERLSEGTVEFLGADISKMPPHRVARRGLGRTYQITRIFLGLTVEQNVIMAAQGISKGRFAFLRPITKSQAVVERARDCLERVDLKRSSTAIAGELGHGQQRQLELALALAADPRVLLLDEPGAGLSAAERALMRDLVRALPEEATVLLIEHDMELALNLSDNVTCMHNGRSIAEGTPEEIKANQQVQDIYLGGGSSDAEGR